MKLALVRRSFDHRSRYARRMALALFVGWSLACPLASDLFAGGVPIPRGVRPGKIPTATKASQGKVAPPPNETTPKSNVDSTAGQANSATQSTAPASSSNTADKLSRYARRERDLRQRLSTAARANYGIEEELTPPEGEAIVVDDTPSVPMATSDSVEPASAMVTDHDPQTVPTVDRTKPRYIATDARPIQALSAHSSEPAMPTARPIAIVVEDRPAPPRDVLPTSYAVPRGNFGLTGSASPLAVPALRRGAVADKIDLPDNAPRAISAMPRVERIAAPTMDAPIARIVTTQAVEPATEPAHAPGLEPLAEPTRDSVGEPDLDSTAGQADSAEPGSVPLMETPPREQTKGPFQIIDQSGELSVTLRRSKLLRTELNVYRTAVVDPTICDIIQFTPREISIVGKAQGATTVTFWFEDDAAHEPLTYLVRVTPDPEVPQRREEQYQVLQDLINGLFPDSKVKLTAVADKLLVQGQARDVEEAAQILAVIRGQAMIGSGGGAGAGGFGLIDGTAADPLVQEETGKRLPATQVVNMLRVPGEQQVALRVKIAELSRSAARRFGVDLDMSFADGNLLLESFLAASGGNAPSVIGHFDGDQINFGIHYLERHGVVRLLSEPTLVTLSGQPASFVAGGEFAVPTVVGVGGASAVTTDFRAFGAIITFLPVVLDKDRIRLQVSPEFSKINTALSVNNTPGLNTRAVATTVEMREGQTLAIAGLLDDSMDANLAGNVPFLYKVLGVRNLTRNETELLILVTPELVHPLDPEEVPPLPGFDVTEPTNWEFFAEGKLEGKPTLEYRSTVWPILKQRYRSGGSAMISGPFGHGQ